MRSTWVNFNSYYNTFYNAKLSYDRGYKQFENQVERINPERPIRVHRRPVRAGRSDFEDAIQRGSDLLIRFPDSRYVDDAVALIGRSYYFMENFFNAEQKFVELFSITNSNTKRQEAVIWRGRIMLDLARHREAINYLQAQIESPDINWGRREQAEAELLLAQHLVKVELYDEAGEYLFRALPNVRDRELRARGYFLHGQILEHLGEYEAAFGAYDRVRRSNPYYQMIYFSELRKGIVMRKLGRNEEAHRIFVSMSRNNNNFDNIAEINYEIGRTLQEMGRTEEARRRYRDVLYRSLRAPTREVIAKTHYGLAEIYRFNLRDYSLAAAHYDTSARNSSDETLLPRGFDSRPLARSFTEFARLNDEVSRMDSLMWLGSLSQAEFDSVITKIQEEYRNRMQRERRQQQRDAGRMVTIDQSEIQEAEEGGQYGYLFHLNNRMMAQASQQFQALWGGRPLVDDWRRAEAVRIAQVAAEEDEELAQDIVYVQEVDPIDLELDLGEIPRTRQAREQLGKELAKTRYQLGNMYFLNLNMPDSASSIYRRIIRDHKEDEIIPQTIYSLSELYYLRGDSVEARQWADLIAQNHQNTLYARRLSDRFQLGLVFEDIELTPKEKMVQDYYSLLAMADTMHVRERAELFWMFAESDTLTGYAPDAYLSSANDFIRLGRAEPGYQERRDSYYRILGEHELQAAELKALQDSAKVVLSDTTITEDLRGYWTQISDSTIAEVDFREYFPYTGHEWDRAREALEAIRERFPRYGRIAHVNSLYSMIELLPEPEPEPEEGEEVPESQDIAEGDEDMPVYPDDWPEADQSQVYTCAETGLEPTVAGGLEPFFEITGLRGMLADAGILEAVFTYRITVSDEGEPMQVMYIGEEDEFRFAEFIQQYIMDYLRFEPLIYNGLRITAICEFDLTVTSE